MSDHPFRNVTYIDRQTAIKAQMTGAVELLYKWKRWNPAIAGGALWSWAAGNVANDVDIFAKSTWWSRRRAKAMYGQSILDAATVNPKIPSNYTGFRSGAGLHVFRTSLSNHPTKVDFVLSNRGISKRFGGIFDYAHCQVGFGLDWYCVDGADAYIDGNIVQLHPDARDKNFVLGKVQTELWKNPEARAKLVIAIMELSKIAGKPMIFSKETPKFL